MNKFVTKMVRKALFEKTFGKPAFKSVTAWGIAVLAVGLVGLDSVCGTAVNTWAGTDVVSSVLPQWLCGPQSTETIGLMLGLLGIRRKQ